MGFSTVNQGGEEGRGRIKSGRRKDLRMLVRMRTGREQEIHEATGSLKLLCRMGSSESAEPRSVPDSASDVGAL